MYDYFFAGDQYIRVRRAETGPGTVDVGYPAPISVWGWGTFGADGIDAALYSGSKCYFFAGREYIRVTRGETGPGAVDPGYPRPISDWGWGRFGAKGIDAALYSGAKAYFFSGDQYIRVTRLGDSSLGTVDGGYPRTIAAGWGWGDFGVNGIDAALYSGAVCYFFSGGQYIRVHRGETGAGILDHGYPQSIGAVWNWGGFGASGIDAALYSGGPLVPPRSGGLVSNGNYFLQQGGQAIPGPTVTMHFDGDLVSAANGFSIQLNGYSQTDDLDAEQQIVVYRPDDSNTLVARIENWVNPSTELIRIDRDLADLPGGKILAGYTLMIAVQTDAQQNVSGATFTLTDENNHVVGQQALTILGKPLSTTGKPATSADLAPITAFQLNIGGDYGGSAAKLTAANGTITYGASGLLSASDTPPADIDIDYYTLETADVSFSQLPVAADAAMTQYFALTSDVPVLGGVTAARAIKGHALAPPSAPPVR
jgi:Hemopexin